jgi:hypothetical protein
LLGIARVIAQNVVLPSLVIEELLAQRARDFDDALQLIKRGAAQADRFVPMPGIYLPATEEAVAPLDADLERHFAIAPLSGETARAALVREIRRAPPTREGRGARDAAIWLTVVEDHRLRNEQGYFVTRNTKDFGNPNSPNELHGALRDDLSGLAPLTFAATTGDLLGLLATDVASPVPSESIIADPTVIQAVRKAIESAVSLATVPAEMAAVSPPYLVSAPSVTSPVLTEYRCFGVGGIVYASAVLSTLSQVQVGILTRVGLGAAEARVTFDLAVACQLWIEFQGAAILLADAAIVSRPVASSIGSGVELAFRAP